MCGAPCTHRPWTSHTSAFVATRGACAATFNDVPPRASRYVSISFSDRVLPPGPPPIPQPERCPEESENRWQKKKKKYARLRRGENTRVRRNTGVRGRCADGLEGGWRGVGARYRLIAREIRLNRRLYTRGGRERGKVNLKWPDEPARRRRARREWGRGVRRSTTCTQTARGGVADEKTH